MTDPIRTAAQALLDAIDAPANDTGKMQALHTAAGRLRAAISAPQPAADERVAEHMRLVREYGQRAVTHHINCGSDVMDTLRKRNEQLAAVESSARALLAAGREDAQMLDWLDTHSVSVFRQGEILCVNQVGGANGGCSSWDKSIRGALRTAIKWAQKGTP